MEVCSGSYVGFTIAELDEMLHSHSYSSQYPTEQQQRHSDPSHSTEKKQDKRTNNRSIIDVDDSEVPFCLRTQLCGLPVLSRVVLLSMPAIGVGVSIHNVYVNHLHS